MERVVLLCPFVLVPCPNGHTAIFRHFVYFAASRFHFGRHVEGRMCGLRAIKHHVNTPPFSVIC